MKNLSDYTNLTWEELLNKTKNWFDLPRAITEALRRLKTLISANQPKYKVYTALLNQTGTDAPIATVLENTLGGDVVWSYENIGDYSATLPIVVDLNKAVIISGTYYNSLNGAVTSTEFNNSQRVRIISQKEITVTEPQSNLENEDELLFNTPIEIRVYS